MCRNFSVSTIRHSEETNENEDENEESMSRGKAYDPKDRTREIPLELSLKYMKSAAYRSTYGEKKIWELYRRNLSGAKRHIDTRPRCVTDGRIATGNPCPICRGEYLVVDYRNLDLIKQFVSEYNGEILTSKKTGVCQQQYKRLLVALEKAKDHGYLDIDPPFISYDYEVYKTTP